MAIIVEHLKSKEKFILLGSGYAKWLRCNNQNPVIRK